MGGRSYPAAFGRPAPRPLRVAMQAHLRGHRVDMLGEPVRTHQFHDDTLAERTGSAFRFVARHAIDDLGRADGPARAQARRQNLRHRPQGDHHTGIVERLQRRDRVSLEAHTAVRIVFENHETMRLRQFDQLSSTRERHGDAGRIVEVRNVEQQLRHPFAIRGEAFQGRLREPTVSSPSPSCGTARKPTSCVRRICAGAVI